MISVRRLFAATSVAAALVAAPTTASAAELPAPPGEVTVLLAPGLEANLDGQSAPFDHAVVAAGDHRLVLRGGAPANVHVDPGCNVLALVYTPTGAADPGVAQSSECPVARPAVGTASIRLAVAVAAESVPSGVALTVDGALIGSPTLAGGASSRFSVQPGRRDLAATVDGQPVRTLISNLAANHAYTVVLIGNGERPAGLGLVDDGAGTTSAPPAGTPVNTDVPTTPANADMTWAWLAVAVALLGVVCAWRSRRRWRASAVVALVLFSAVLTACGPTVESGAKSASAGTDSLGANVAPVLPPTADAPKTAPVQVTLPNAAAMRIEERPAASVGTLPSALPITVAAHVGGTGQGNLVLAGHVNGAFGTLASAAVGDKVFVRFADGTSKAYAIDGGLVRRKDEPWLAAWAPTARPILVLVTCTGDVDPTTRLHEDNLWITATPVAN